MTDINNSSSVLPDTRLDLHTLYTEGGTINTYQVLRSTVMRCCTVLGRWSAASWSTA